VRRSSPAVQAFWEAPTMGDGVAALELADPEKIYLPLAQQGAAHIKVAERQSLGGEMDRAAQVTRVLRVAIQRSTNRLEGGLTVLASIGATAPFVGLLGTVWGIYHALANVSANETTKRDAAIAKAEACIKARPDSAKCHHALGRLYGAAALSSGLVNGLKYVSRIKEEFTKAVELDPRNFDSRRELNQFYLHAPGIAGGSVRRAIENSEAHAKISAAQGQLLRAEVHIYEKEFDKADSLLSTIRPAGDEVTARVLPQTWSGLGFAMINDKQAAKAQTLFERLLTTDANNALMHLGLGRAQLENQAVDAAIASLERALKIDSKLNAHYRLGIAYQTKGDKPKAIAAFQQFLSYSTTGKPAEDAKQRIETMKKSG
jgi:tetratricopeptide (TPR) repeat protein